MNRRVGIGIMSFRQATDLRRSIESVQYFQPAYDLVVFIDPCRPDLDRAQVDVCEEMGVHYVLHEKWRYQPGAFNAICDYFFERGYEFCIAHHHDAIMLGPVVDKCLKTWDRWNDEGVQCGGVQPVINYSSHNGIPYEDWFDEPLEKLKYRNNFYNMPRDHSGSMECVDCEWLVWLPAYAKTGPVDDSLYFFHYGFSRMMWMAGFPLVYAPAQDCYVLHTGLRTWPGDFYKEADEKFNRAAELLEKAYSGFDAPMLMSKVGMYNRRIDMPFFIDGNLVFNIQNPKYPVMR